MNGLLHDIRIAQRVLRRNPQTTALAVVTMAVAVAASVTVFSAVNGMLVQPVAFPDAERLAAIWRVDEAQPDAWRVSSLADFVDWREQSQVFSGLEAAINVSLTTTGFDDPETPLMRRVTPGYFALLGAQPLLGRAFNENEGQSGSDRVVILSHEFWQRRFGGDTAVVGATLELDEEPYVIVGVMPGPFDNPAFGMTNRPMAWMPATLEVAELDRRRFGAFVFARLGEGETWASAQTALSAIAARLRDAYPETNQRRDVAVTPIAERLVRDVRPAILLLLGAALFVVLIACGNVANLLLGRALTRRREMAVRQALGAARRQVIRQMVIESLVLGLLSGGLGLLLAIWSIGWVESLIPVGFNIPQVSFVLDRTVLLFALGLSLAAGLAFGLVPALVAARFTADSALAAGGLRLTAGRVSSRLRGGLVTLEVALSLVLLVGAGLMLRSLHGMHALDPGFDASNTLLFRVSTRGPDFQDETVRAEFFERVLESLADLPGVSSVGAAQAPPFFPQFMERAVTIDALPMPEPGTEPRAVVNGVLPGYLETLRIPLLAGRMINDRDRADREPVALVSRRFAQQIWGDADPLGQRISVLGGSVPSRLVVGVTGDLRVGTVPPEPQAGVYVPLLQEPGATSLAFFLRTDGDPMAALDPARRQIAQLDRAMPVYLPSTSEEQMAVLDWRPRFIGTLLGIFAVLALCLAASGLYAVLAYTVSRRRREISIRMALGALPRDVIRMVVRGGLTLVVGGLGFGMVGAFALSRFLQSQLYEITATDPVTHVVVALLLLVVGLMACYLPARRATQVQPAAALWLE